MSIVSLLLIISGKISSKTRTKKGATIKIKKPTFDEIYKKIEPLLIEDPLIKEHETIITKCKKELKNATGDHKKMLRKEISQQKSALKKLKENTLTETIHDIQRKASKSDSKESFNNYKKHFDEIKKIYTKTSAWKILETLKPPKHLQRKS